MSMVGIMNIDHDELLRDYLIPTWTDVPNIDSKKIIPTMFQKGAQRGLISIQALQLTEEKEALLRTLLELRIASNTFDRKLENGLDMLKKGELGIWVRLHYVYPYPHVDDIIPLMRDKLILPYLDIPLQHASTRVLKAMKRPASSENTLARIKHWRDICPDITLRSTFIVGFPGETESEFEELLTFLDEAKLDRVGCFQYSPVDGARANALADPVPDDVKEDRYHRFMQLQAGISRDKLASKIGSQQTVLIDHINDEQIVARSMSDAPEIDGLVYLPPTAGVKVGTRVVVNITDSDDYDLFGEVL